MSDDRDDRDDDPPQSQQQTRGSRKAQRARRVIVRISHALSLFGFPIFSRVGVATARGVRGAGTTITTTIRVVGVRVGEWVERVRGRVRERSRARKAERLNARKESLVK